MIEKNFQMAVERLLSDEAYSKRLFNEPSRLANDYKLNNSQINALKSTEKLGVQTGGVKAVGLCCCTCNVMIIPAESN